MYEDNKKTKVKFIVRIGAYKVNDEAMVSYPIALDFFERGYVERTDEIVEYAKFVGKKLSRKNVDK